MFKKLLVIFSLEERLANSVNQNFALTSASNQKHMDAFEKRIAAGSAQLDKLESDINRRLSRLEVLFAEELAAKEKARDALICEKRREAQ